MATTAPTTVMDGFTSLEGGVDSGLVPSILGATQLAWATNATMRGGFIQRRPGMVARAIEWGSSADRGNFATGRFQGAAWHSRPEGEGSLVVHVGGRVYVIDIDNFRGVDITLPGDANRTETDKVWFAQAEDWTIIQDGSSKPLIYDGATLRRAINGEVPTGTVMAYTNGRLWVTRADRRSFTAGDLVYSASGTGNRRNAVLKFSDAAILANGGDFAVPSGRITAMSPIGVVDTSLGQGPLQVFTETDIYSVNVPLDRSQWGNLTQPIQTLSMRNFGATGDWSVVAVNGDLYFRSLDGVRSFIAARRDFTTPGNTPISREVSRVLDRDGDQLLENCSAALFDNRLLMTTGPEWGPRGVYWTGLVPLNFDMVSGLRSKLPPAWEGVWTGRRVMQVVSAGKRCFLLTLNCDEEVELWELLKEWGEEDVTWSFETRSYAFQDGLYSKKRLTGAHMWYDQVRGRVKVDVEMRSDQEPCWNTWNDWRDHVIECVSLEGECSNLCPPKLGYEPKHSLPRPPETCGMVGRVDQGFEFQFRVQVQGDMRVIRFLAEADRIHEERGKRL